MYKGQGGVVYYFAWDVNANAPKTGDVANHTLRLIKDGGSPAAPTNSASEVDATNAPGLYKLTVTTAEATCVTLALHGKSSTSGVYIMPQLFEPIDMDRQTDLVWDEQLTGNAHNGVNSAGRRLRSLGAGVVVFSGTLSAATSNTATLGSGSAITDDFYSGATLVITAGQGVGQSRRIVNYTALTRVCSLDRAWAITPTSGSTFEIIAGVGGINAVEGSIVSATSTTVVIGNEGSTVDDTYNGGVIAILSGTGSGQFKDITDYVGSTKTVTVNSAWSPNPDATSTYSIVPAGTAEASTGAAPTAVEIANQVYSSFRLKSGAAIANYSFVMTLTADGAPATGKTVTVERSIDGGAFASTGISNVAEIASGAYKCDLAASALTGSVILLKFSAADCNTFFEKIVTTP